MRFSRYVAAVLGLLACCPSIGLADQEELPGADVLRSFSANRSLGSERSARDMEGIKLDTYLLPDEQGQLQPMLGWTFEDFVRVWKSQQALAPADEEPLFSLQRLECRGKLENHQSVLMQASIQIRLQSDHRVCVPLGFPNATLTGYETAAPDGLAYLSYDEGRGEHVLWVEGEADQTLEVQLQLLLPLARRGDQTVLRLHPPRAVSSRLTLSVPADVVAESGSPPMRVSSTSGQGTTTIDAVGLTETSELVWRSSAEAEGSLRSIVAESHVLARVEQGLLRSDITLTIQDLHDALRRFRIQLPAHARLVAEELDGATIRQVTDGTPTSNTPQSDPDTAEGAIYEVGLAEPRQAPFLVKMTLQRPLNLGEDETSLLLEGAQVLGAVRQQGSVYLSVAEDLRVRWQEGHRVRQIAPPSEASAEFNVLAAFAIDAADWRLPVLVSHRPTEISVEPDYAVEIRKDRLRLTATFRYSVRGTKRIDLRYALGPWELADDPQGPETTISGSNAYVDDAGTMYLPLTSPVEGTFETTLHLKMDRSPAAGLLRVRLPECLDGQVQDGELRVTAHPSLEVIPQSRALLGLGRERQVGTAAVPPEPEDHSTQSFHVSSLPAEYVAVVRPRNQLIVSETRARVGVYPDHIQVEQDMQLDVRHLPATEVVLQVPSAISTASLAFEVDGQSVAPVQDGPATQADGADMRIVRLVLEEPRLGGVSLRTRFDLPLAPPAGDDPAKEVVVPLVVPQANTHHFLASLTNYTNELQVQFRNIQGTGSDTASPSYPVVSPGDRSNVEVTAPVQRLPIRVRPASTTSQRAIMVDRTWIQSWVVGSTVHLRTAMRFMPTADDVVVRLGAGSAAELHSVEVNGRPIWPATDQELILRLGDFQPNAPCVIEIVQQAPLVLGSDGTMQVVPPRIANGRYRNVFWQLILPQSLHGFSRVDQFVSASPWRYEGIYWARVPAMSQADLEEYVGTSHVPPPAGSTNQLLMRGFELPRVLEASLVRRSTLVLVTSGMILAVGVVLLYVRFLHRFELAVALIIAIALGGTLYPDVAPLIVQAGVLGVVLTLAAVFFKRLTDRWRAASQEGSLVDSSNILRRESSSHADQSASPSAAEPSSSARTAVPSLSEPGMTHST